MTNHDDLDPAFARLVGADPALARPAVPVARLERMARVAMAPTPGALAHARYRLTAIGAAVASSAAVVAGIVGLSTTTPVLPILALSSSTGSHAPAAMVSGERVGYETAIYGAFDVSASPNLEVVGGGAPAVSLTVSSTPTEVATTLAAGVGLAGDPHPQSSASPGSADGVIVGDEQGANVQAWTSGGLVNFSSTSSTSAGIVVTPAVGAASASSDATSPGTATSSGTAPTTEEAIQAATALVAPFSGSAVAFGTPTTYAGASDVTVDLPLVVHGITTTLSDTVDVGAGGTILSSNGVVVDLGSNVAYPTVSAADAIASYAAAQAAQAQSEGIGVPTTTAPAGDATGSSGTSAGTDPVPATTDTTVDGTAIPPTTESTTPTTAPAPSGPPIYTVVIDHATEQYEYAVTADGTGWLLPVWDLTGTSNSGAGTPQQPGFERQVLELDPAYVDLAPSPMMVQ